MALLALSLLGPLYALRDEQAITDFVYDKVRALLLEALDS